MEIFDWYGILLGILMGSLLFFYLFRQRAKRLATNRMIEASESISRNPFENYAIGKSPQLGEFLQIGTILSYKMREDEEGQYSLTFQGSSGQKTFIEAENPYEELP